MIWTAILLVLVLVPGGSKAYGLLCDETTAHNIAAGDFAADQLRLRGFFVDPDRQTRVFLRVLLNERASPYHECFLQHEDGPLSRAGGYWTGLAGRCHDPVSGRDHVIVSKTDGGSGSIPSNQYWSVQPDTKQMRLEYEQGVLIDKEAERVPWPQSLVGADGQCRWRQYSAARGVFHSAIAALRVGTVLLALDLEAGETLTPPTRPLPAAVVRHWLHELHTHTPAFATFETARDSGESHTQSWRVLQILGRQLCNAEGVVLLQDMRSGQWRSIYDVPSGCQKSLNFPLLDMRITGDTLFAKFCTECSWWGDYGEFTLDLPTNRITRLEEEEVPWEENIPIPDPLAFVDQGGRAMPRAADAAR